MKNFKIWAIALMAVLGFASCSEDCDHDFIEYDYSKDLVGTWTCLKGDFAEALVFKADGSFASVGVTNGECWEENNATWVLKNNKLTLTSDDYKSDVVLEIIPGKGLALINEQGTRNVFEYCENDLSDEIVGMWVCNEAPVETENNMGVQSFDANGIATLTGYTSQAGDFIVKSQADYKVIGDLLIQKLPEDKLVAGVSPYLVLKVVYDPNANALGDMMIQKRYVVEGGNTVEKVSSWLRVKQELNLVGKKYSYNNVYLSNVKGSDKEIDFMGYKFAFANMDGSRLEMVMKSALFGIEFPDANTVSYTYQLNGISETYTLPIVVEGNKMTFKMSAKVPSLKDVVFYAFQDADDSQLHLYIHQSSFVSFFTNMQAIMAAAVDPTFDITNPAAIDAIYNEIDAAVESINLSVVMK